MGKKNALLFLIAKTFHIAVGLCLLLSLLTPYINPAKFPLLPFLGLGFPVLILLNIVFCILWFFKNRTWFLCSLILFGLSLPYQIKIFSFNVLPTDIPKESDSRIKLMSYNVRLFDLYNPSMKNAKSTRNGIFKYFRDEEPDILCIQEYYEQKKPSSFITIDSIVEIMDDPQIHIKGIQIPRNRQTFGLATFSKLPVVNKGYIKHQGANKNNNNYCIYIDVTREKDTLRIYNVHLQSIKLETNYATKNTKDDGTENTQSTIKTAYRKLKKAFAIRAEQSKTVSQHIKKSPYPTIVCGDFNDTPISYTYHIFENELIDAFRNTSSGFGSTYIGLLPAGRIDYIFHSKELNSTSFKIQKEKLSDHRAISCVIY
jgi:endonuclease/exonuclease/phosphatase family metal-dependent hydrolase